jgi:subtilisin-like proprotein convertase family protein
MKRILILAILMLAGVAARATLYTQSFSGGTIADGNPAGQVFSGSFDTAPSGTAVSSFTVSLNLSGGYNGDLYAYLVAPNGTMVVLMNQPGVSVNGFGASGAGMNITLSDGVFSSIQTETGGGILTGTYNAAGTLADFSGSSANGTWQLYFADLSNGGGTSTLDSWALNITAVPEPVNIALGVFGGVALLSLALRRHRITPLFS